MSSPPEDVTALLTAVSSGNQEAWKKLFSIVYKKLHQFAHTAMQKEHPGHTLQTTDLVHEAYIRLVKSKEIRMKNRKHFFCVAARAMRRILVDKARTRKKVVRRNDLDVVSLTDARNLDSANRDSFGLFEDLDALSYALGKLEEKIGNKRMGHIIDLHFFVGLSFDQTAEVLGVSPGTVYNDWRFSKAWIRREMERTAGYDQ